MTSYNPHHSNCSVTQRNLKLILFVSFFIFIYMVQFVYVSEIFYLIPWITSIESAPKLSVVIIDEFLTIQKHDKNRSNSEFGLNFGWFICGVNVDELFSTFRMALLFEHLMLLLLPLMMAFCFDSNSFSFKLYIDETILV